MQKIFGICLFALPFVGLFIIISIGIGILQALGIFGGVAILVLSIYFGLVLMGK